MNTVALETALTQARVPWYARQILQLLRDIDHGSLDIRLPNDLRFTLGHGAPHANLNFISWSALKDALARGDIGFADAYIAGTWSTTNLAALLNVLAHNRDALGSGLYGHSWWGRLIARLKHLVRDNSRKGSRRNIAEHYDLGNDFYSLWLDPTMSYSAARFDGDTSLSLADAQTRKYQAMLDLVTRDRSGPLDILEIGCGWGGFAEHAGRAGHRVRGLTLSNEQLDYANNRLAAAGLADNCRMVYQDYRDETGLYDAVVSIEMFEAVGERYWPAYFQTLAKSLKPGGRAAVQTILIDDALFDRYRSGSDFIQQYIFPGGMLPSAGRFADEARKAGLKVRAEHHFGADYAETLARWRHSFFERISAIEQLGFDDRFQRIWHFYLAYCEAGFAAGSIDVAQFSLERPA